MFGAISARSAAFPSRHRPQSALTHDSSSIRTAFDIHETHLQIGRRTISWADIRRLDQTGWNVPLVLQLTLEHAGTLFLIYPGDLDSSGSLLRHLRRYSRHALLDGVPYREFW